MNCPFCDSTQVNVKNSRPTRAATQIWRRRRCLNCHNSFTTYEKMDLSFLKVAKRSGKKEYYRRAKLYAGIYHASVDGKNMDRGHMAVISEKITNRIEQEILSLKRKTISTGEILNLVTNVLKNKYPEILFRYLAYFRSRDTLALKHLVKSAL